MSGEVLVREFEEYVKRLGRVVGDKRRKSSLEGYCLGLIVPTHNGRKSVEPMAAQVQPGKVDAKRQSMTHFVGQAQWSDEAVMKEAWDYMQEKLGQRSGQVLAWVVDDTGVPKKGKHSVGVAHQYCGVLGKTANCQVAVCVSAIGESFSLPMAWRLYLNKDWANDADRREKAGVPESVSHRTKWQLALDELERLEKAGLPKAPVLADCAYGEVTEFRQELRKRGWHYGVSVSKNLSVWRAGTGPQKPQWTGRGRPPSLFKRSAENQPVSVEELARGVSAKSFKSVNWRKGTKGRMTSRFTACRVRPAHRDYWKSTPHEELWLVIEWPKGAKEAENYWLCSLPESTPLKELVSVLKHRWRIERDFQELKDELGLDHYEGRGWRGFHHHGTLCIATYAFITANRESFFSLPAKTITAYQKSPPVRQTG